MSVGTMTTAHRHKDKVLDSAPKTAEKQNNHRKYEFEYGKKEEYSV